MQSDVPHTTVPAASLRGPHYAEALAGETKDPAESFRTWWSECSSKGWLRLASPQLMEVDQALSSKFMIGIFGRRFYIGVPPEAATWFFDAPWIHLAVRPGFSGVALVCGRFKSGKKAMNDFALYFSGVPAAIATTLGAFHYIDVRGIVNGQYVTKEAFMTMEVVPVHGEVKFDTFASGASSAAFHRQLATQRSAA